MKHIWNEYGCMYLFLIFILLIPLFCLAGNQCSTPLSYNYQSGMNTVTFSTVDSIDTYTNSVSMDDSINIKLTKYGNKEILVIVQNILGEVYYSKVIIMGFTKQMIFVTDPYKNLSKGTYIITGSSNNNLYHKKLVIN